MELNEIIRNYAEAFYSVVKDKKGELDFLSELKKGMEKSKEFRSVLNHPYIEISKKLNLIEKILGNQLNEYEKNFLKVLFDNRRINLLDKIFEKYNQIFIEHSDIQPVEILTPKEIPEDLLNELKEVLEEKLDKKIIPQVKINKDLLGGIRLKMNGEVYDNTVRKMLKSFQNKLTQEAI